MPRNLRSTLARQTVQRYLIGRSRRRWSYTVLVLVVALLLMWLDRSGLLVESRDDLARYDGKWFTVTRVIDGDTLEIDAPDGGDPVTRIRLWGVDTPEMARHDPPRPAEPLAEQATERVRELVQSRRVRVRLEPHRLRDRYGRLLAFVEMTDGRLLNELLIAEGYSPADDRWSHRYLERFQRIEKQAREEKKGLWADH